MAYRLGQLSRSKLEDVDPALVRCVERAIEITKQDFCVHEGLRSLERQRALFESGASRTMDSYHLPDRFGIVRAVDLVPWIAGKPQWQEVPCEVVAVAMHQASREFSTPLVWGAVWDRKLHELDVNDLDGEIAAYVLRYRKKHGPKARALIDRPHFQGQRPAEVLPEAA